MYKDPIKNKEYQREYQQKYRKTENGQKTEHNKYNRKRLEQYNTNLRNGGRLPTEHIMTKNNIVFEDGMYKYKE